MTKKELLFPVFPHRKNKNIKYNCAKDNNLSFFWLSLHAFNLDYGVMVSH